MATLAEIRARIAARDKKKLDKRKAAGKVRMDEWKAADKKYRAAQEKKRIQGLKKKEELRNKGAEKALKEGRLNDAANLKSNANLAKKKQVSGTTKAKKAQMDKYVFKANKQKPPTVKAETPVRKAGKLHKKNVMGTGNATTSRHTPKTAKVHTDPKRKVKTATLKSKPRVHHATQMAKRLMGGKR
jgi:hypothetical protein